MKNIKEIRTYKTFNDLYKDFINSTDNEDTDMNKSIILKEIKNNGLFEENEILYILDEFELLN